MDKPVKSIKLRAMEPEDLDLLYKIENEDEVWNVCSSNVPYSRYTLFNYIADASNDIYLDGQVRLIIENDNQETVGVMDIVNFEPMHQRAELGFIILNEYRGQGYGYSAIRKVLDYTKNTLHLRQVYAFVDVSNTSSLKCLSLVGFQETVILKDWFFHHGKYNDAVIMQFFL